MSYAWPIVEVDAKMRRFMAELRSAGAARHWPLSLLEVETVLRNLYGGPHLNEEIGAGQHNVKCPPSYCDASPMRSPVSMSISRPPSAKLRHCEDPGPPEKDLARRIGDGGQGCWTMHGERQAQDHGDHAGRPVSSAHGR